MTSAQAAAVADSAPDGLVVVDKPGGWTSHDVVGKTRRLARTRKVGHAGTLDPMATGVLLLGLGKATRLLGHLALTDKDYDATIRLGQTTVTDDAEGDVLTDQPVDGVTPEDVAREVAALTGDLLQVPSAVSAVKVDGVRSYARVRAGESVELKPRPVTVSRFEVRAWRGPELDVSVTCSSGTYIRALARDLGAALGVGGHLTALRRTRVGPFTLADAGPLEPWDDARVLLLDDAVRQAFPVRELSAEEAVALSYGKKLAPTPGLAGAFAPGGECVALVEDGRPLVVFRPA